MYLITLTPMQWGGIIGIVILALMAFAVYKVMKGIAVEQHPNLEEDQFEEDMTSYVNPDADQIQAVKEKSPGIATLTDHINTVIENQPEVKKKLNRKQRKALNKIQNQHKHIQKV